VVVMLGILLILSSLIYYLRHASNIGRAVANVAVLLLVSLGFFSGLSAFRKSTPVTMAPRAASIDHLLNELKEGEPVHQLDALAHLKGMHDAKITPALADLLARSPSEQIVESAVELLKERNDPRALPALRQAARGNHDNFLKLSIAEAQLALGDREGFSTLMTILQSDEAGLARQQANALLEKQSEKQFGYQPEKDVKQNLPALLRIAAWLNGEAKTLHWDATTRRFQAQK
jgi:HEAT repeat protein